MKPKIDLERLKRIIEAVNEKQLACSDGNCVWPKERGGMVTNGGCHCLSYKLEPKQRASARVVFDTFKLVPDLIELIEDAIKEMKRQHEELSKSFHLPPKECSTWYSDWLAHFKKEGEK